jgi:hypothetical protein
MAIETNVVSLRGGEIPKPAAPASEAPCADVIEALERALLAAKAGEIIGLAGVFLNADRTPSLAAVGTTNQAQLGLIECLKHTIVQNLERR